MNKKELKEILESPYFSEESKKGFKDAFEEDSRRIREYKEKLKWPLYWKIILVFIIGTFMYYFGAWKFIACLFLGWAFLWFCIEVLGENK